MPAEFDHRRVNPVDADEQAELAREAAELHAILEAREGSNKALVIIAGYMPDKRADARAVLNSVSAQENTSYVVTSYYDGRSPITLYQEFRKQEQQGKQTNVVAALDGNLDEPEAIYRTGIQVARNLVEISNANGWQAPYLVGISSGSKKNNLLKEAFPTHFVGAVQDFTDYEQTQELIKNLDSRLAPPPTPPQK